MIQQVRTVLVPLVGVMWGVTCAVAWMAGGCAQDSADGTPLSSQSLTTTSPTTSPDSTTAPAAVIVVLEVVGPAHIRTTPRDQWQAVKAGQTVPLGATIRTGPRAHVTLRSATDTWTIDRLTTTEITPDFVRSPTSRPYGRTRYDTTTPTTIESPDATLKVRG